MSIRLRVVDGCIVALCAVEADPVEGDIYLDDATHEALAAKFARDWQGQTVDWRYPENDALAESQRVRDAEQEILKVTGREMTG